MSYASRRMLFTGLAAVSSKGEPKAAQGDSARGKFAPRLSGREMLRRRYFPNLELVSSDGQSVRFYDDLLKDKIVVLNLMYANCEGICPTITANLQQVRKFLDQEIKHDIFIYSITIKPEEDSPATLRQYAKAHNIHDPRWLFLTGEPENIEILRHTLGFADPDPKVDKDKARHSGMLRYGNERMSIWGTCQGSAEPEWIAQEIGFAVPREFKKHPRVNE